MRCRSRHHGYASSIRASATLPFVIDVRDSKAVLGRLRRAERAFERGAPVPIAARELLDELADALADSGPLELRASTSCWLSGVDSARTGAEAANDSEQPRKAVRHARKSIRELKALFGGHSMTWYGWLWVPWVALVVGLTLIFVLPMLLLVTLIDWVKRRYLPSVRQVVSALEVEDRALFAHTVSATGPAVKSTKRIRLRAYVHPVLVATRTHLLLAEPSSERPVRPDQQHFAIAWELPYARIQSFSSRALWTGETELNVRAPQHHVAYKLPTDEGAALVAILNRHAPEAVDPLAPMGATREFAANPAAPPPPRAAAGARMDHPGR